MKTWKSLVAGKYHMMSKRGGISPKLDNIKRLGEVIQTKMECLQLKCNSAVLHAWNDTSRVTVFH